MILVIDNYDSFTYNLVQQLGRLGASCQVVLNDQLSVTEVAALDPKQIILSPGPKTPREAGICCQVIQQFQDQIPILGVCLGHQCLGAVFGGQIVPATKLRHGKCSPIFHQGDSIFNGLPSPFPAARYNSLRVVEPGPELQTLAVDDYGDIMALRHRVLPLFGVQFHPESFMTEVGDQLLTNFLNE